MRIQCRAGICVLLICVVLWVPGLDFSAEQDPLALYSVSERTHGRGEVPKRVYEEWVVCRDNLTFFVEKACFDGLDAMMQTVDQIYEDVRNAEEYCGVKESAPLVAVLVKTGNSPTAPLEDSYCVGNTLVTDRDKVEDGSYFRVLYGMVAGVAQPWIACGVGTMLRNLENPRTMNEQGNTREGQPVRLFGTDYMHTMSEQPQIDSAVYWATKAVAYMDSQDPAWIVPVLRGEGTAVYDLVCAWLASLGVEYEGKVVWEWVNPGYRFAYDCERHCAVITVDDSAYVFDLSSIERPAFEGIAERIAHSRMEVGLMRELFDALSRDLFEYDPAVSIFLQKSHNQDTYTNKNDRTIVMEYDLFPYAVAHEAAHLYTPFSDDALSAAERKNPGIASFFVEGFAQYYSALAKEYVQESIDMQMLAEMSSTESADVTYLWGYSFDANAVDAVLTYYTTYNKTGEYNQRLFIDALASEVVAHADEKSIFAFYPCCESWMRFMIASYGEKAVWEAYMGIEDFDDLFPVSFDRTVVEWIGYLENRDG